jgi:glycosyltransferase involved in cell wall biosynthesis
MRILLGSHHFAPQIGGIEAASLVLATEFARRGHDVKVVTQTPCDAAETWPFEVIRRPSAGRLFSLAAWSQVFFQNNISLQTLWAAFAARRPWVVAHQTWITRVSGALSWRDRLKRRLLGFATNVAISQAVARDLALPSTIVGNPYDHRLFRLIEGVPRTRELIFVGRLVSDKGLDLLIEALAQLRSQNLTPTLTVVGSGPEEPAVRAQAYKVGVAGQVEFLGAMTGEPLAELLNRHEIMVIPSRWAEPFGIVALEGIACGCALIGSEEGGLREAMGPCGLAFPNGDATALAASLATLLADPARRENLRAGRAEHLAKFHPERVAEAYLALFHTAAP